MCVSVRAGYQVATYSRAYKVNVEAGMFVRRCTFAVSVQKCQAAGPMGNVNDTKGKSQRISRCLLPEMLPFVCQMLEIDGA